MDAPCKECDVRHYKCHSDCERYLTYKKERVELSRARFKESNINSHIIEREQKRRERKQR